MAGPARVAHWLSVQQSLAIEAVAALVLYATYEAARGPSSVIGASPSTMLKTIASLERRLHLFIEPSKQHAPRAVPGLLTLRVVHDLDDVLGRP